MNEYLKRIILTPLNLLYKVNPEWEMRLLYRLKLGKKLNLDAPKTYLEKLNWLKLRYRDSLMPKCADKYHAREYISENGFAEYLPKLLWQGENPEHIPWDDLPDRFVVKVTSGSGGNIICKNKSTLDRNATQKKLWKLLKRKYLPCYGEWIYDVLPPRIIVEEFLSDGVNVVPVDYKCFCFNGLGGDVGCIAVDLGRFVEHKRNIYDSEWNFLENVSFNFATDPDADVSKPDQYEKMRQIAKKLAAPFPHVRVDFYVLGERFYIGELTFFNGAGFDRIMPENYDLLMGSWIKLPE